MEGKWGSDSKPCRRWAWRAENTGTKTGPERRDPPPPKPTQTPQKKKPPPTTKQTPPKNPNPPPPPPPPPPPQPPHPKPKTPNPNPSFTRKRALGGGRKGRNVTHFRCRGRNKCSISAQNLTWEGSVWLGIGRISAAFSGENNFFARTKGRAEVQKGLAYAIG